MTPHGLSSSRHPMLHTNAHTLQGHPELVFCAFTPHFNSLSADISSVQSPYHPEINWIVGRVGELTLNILSEEQNSHSTVSNSSVFLSCPAALAHGAGVGIRWGSVIAGTIWQPSSPNVGHLKTAIT